MIKKRQKRILALAGILLIGGFALALWKWNLTVNYAPAVATVISAEPKYIGESAGIGGHISPHYRPKLKLRYSVNGNLIFVELIGPENLRVNIGQTLKIRYRKSKPDECSVYE